MSKKLKIMKVLSFVPDEYFNKIFFFYKNGYWPNFKEPKSFNEKINHIKLFSKNPLRKLAADRIKVRDYVAEKSPDCKLINLLWVGKEFTQEIYNELPQRFVIKANHGSGMVRVVNKDKIGFEQIKEETQKWIAVDYGKVTRQPAYNDLDKVLVVEEFLDIGLDIVPDYKFMCIDGKVEMIQVDLDRFIGHKRNIYDKNFERLDVKFEFEQGDDVEKPKLFDKAIKISEELSTEYDMLRVDLYISDDEIYFGELTNTPDNGYGKFQPQSFDFELGEKWNFQKEFE